MKVCTGLEHVTSTMGLNFYLSRARVRVRVRVTTCMSGLGRVRVRVRGARDPDRVGQGRVKPNPTRL